jgi:ankyrin repeat protein
MNAASCNNEHLKRIYDTLLKRGVDSKCKDNFGRNALHYSVISKSMNLVQMLLEVGSYNLNEIDIYGHSPLSLCLKGKNSSSLYYFDSTRDTIFTLLCKKGANVNIVYPESDF